MQADCVTSLSSLSSGSIRACERPTTRRRAHIGAAGRHPKVRQVKSGETERIHDPHPFPPLSQARWRRYRSIPRASVNRQSAAQCARSHHPTRARGSSGLTDAVEDDVEALVEVRHVLPQPVQVEPVLDKSALDLALFRRSARQCSNSPHGGHDPTRTMHASRDAPRPPDEGRIMPCSKMSNSGERHVASVGRARSTGVAPSQRPPHGTRALVGFLPRRKTRAREAGRTIGPTTHLRWLMIRSSRTRQCGRSAVARPPPPAIPWWCTKWLRQRTTCN